MLTVVRSPRAALAALVTVTALALSGCSSAEPETETSASAAAADAFPVTITSALGDAVIPAAPERVVTLGWSSQDAALALGVVPVAMPKNTYGGDADGFLPWDADKIKELGGTPPALLPEGTDVPFEEIVEAEPDVILAPYSGITQDDFDKLSKVAPVVAYPEKPWSLAWQDQIEIVGKALGRSGEAADLLAQTQASVKALADENPGLKDKTFFYAAANEADLLNVYRENDPRVGMLVDLGLTPAASVKDLDAKPTEGDFFYQLSYENVSKIETDLLVMYFASQADVDKFVADPVIAALPAIKEGRFAPIVGESFVMATSAPTVLSIPWMLDQYVPQLAEVAAKAAE
ncbi:iron complex transport system substrate-binding protein [Actinocorallia herbida]|uniref:Iron complex transport system substrate-binding protein n=1 Tax=Actinocorallia herbida TaxID=58109 RepID=A0A3N1CWE7_9ACTN|nr:iron-siderophore ABC transporter substrate-binding protein [Actinocorallia herbida]ROO85545.1 iron complex transport system substrate-binding protein [Actinocorallia herbida]